MQVFTSGELRRMILGGPIEKPSYPPFGNKEGFANHLRTDGRKLFFGADGSIFRETDEVYVLGARQPMMTVKDVCIFIDWGLVHFVPGGARIGHRIAIVRMENGCDIRADEVVAVNRGFVANRIRNYQQRWRKYFY